MREAIEDRLKPAYIAGYFKGDTSERTHVQLFRYAFVAVIAFVVDFGTLAYSGSVMHIYYLYAAALAFCVGLVTNYLLSTAWVFQGHGVTDRVKEFTTFLITGLIGLALTELLIWLLTSGGGINYLISKIITAFVVVLWNFSSRKVLLYRTS